MKHFTSPSQRFGKIGEDLAVDFLVCRKFLIIERNYTKKIGEIDIIAYKNDTVHFIEVKTCVSRVTNASKILNVSRETSEKHSKSFEWLSNYHPFENITYHKMRKIKRTIEYYFLEKGLNPDLRKNISYETISYETCSRGIRNRKNVSFQIDIIAVFLDPYSKSAKIETLWNVT